MGNLDKVAAGQRIRSLPAQDWNAFIDAARAERGDRLGQRTESDLVVPSATIVLVKNNTGLALPRFSVLGLGEPVADPDTQSDLFRQQIVFHGQTPGTEHHGKFVVLQQDLPDGFVGEAVIAGVTIVRLGAGGAGSGLCDVEPGEVSRLRGDPTGSTRVLYRQPGDDVVWAVVRLGDRPRFAIFELRGDWSAGRYASGSGGSGQAVDSPGWARMDACRVVRYFGESDNYEPSGNEVATVWHAVGYVGPEREKVRKLHAATGLFPSVAGCGDWVWCHWNEDDQRWQLLQTYENLWRFALLGRLAQCGSATAALKRRPRQRRLRPWHLGFGQCWYRKR